jgi:serine/threonine-protein kinase HipA
MTISLQVLLQNKEIGNLSQLSNGSMVFAFNEDYLNDKNRYILSQSFFLKNSEIMPESKVSRIQLPPFFSNLLPEGYMREYLAQKGGVKPSNEFKLIELLGEDLPGAIEVKSTQNPSNNYEIEDENIEVSQPFNFSLAGIQLKFSAIAAKNGGLTIPAHGVGGDWIIKLPAQNYENVPENEFAIMDIARKVGIPIPEIKLVEIEDIAGLPEMGVLQGKKALAVRRFDRGAKGKKIHIEDFAQVYNVYPHNKYEGVSYANMAYMLWILTGEAGLTDFISRLAYMVVTGNGDMHLKNWSLIYYDGKTPSLSPAYDLLSTIPYIPKDGLALNLGDSKNIGSIKLENFKKLAKKANVPENLVLNAVKDAVQKTYDIWKTDQKNYQLPSKILKSINDYMDKVSLKNL